MALIKNAYSPGQWYVFFYEDKNVEQTSYYNNVEKKFSSWYSFLQKDQIQGKIFDFLGVPNCCGKINKMQLRKIYAKEQSKQIRFDKLDVQVKRIQMNDTPQSSVKNFKIFSSKNNSKRSDRNKTLENKMTQIDCKVDKRRTIEEKNSFPENCSMLPRQVQLDCSEQFDDNNSSESSVDSVAMTLNTGFLGDDPLSNSDDVLTQSDEDISKRPKVISDPRTPINNESQKDVTKLPRCTADGKTLKKFVTSIRPSADKEIVTEKGGLNRPSTVPKSFPKKKVEFNNVNEYFYFKEINSSTTHSSHSDVFVNSKRTELAAEYNDNSSNDDDNAFDTGLLSPAQDYSSASPLLSQEKGSPGDASIFGTSETHNHTRSCSESDKSADSDNAFDTGFSSPVQEFCSESPLQTQERATPYETFTVGASGDGRKGCSHERYDSTKKDENGNDKDSLPRIQEVSSASQLQPQKTDLSYEPATVQTRNTNEWENDANQSAYAIAEKSAATHSMASSQSQPERDFPVDRRVLHTLSVISNDDEVLSQTSAMTEVFATSIMVDLRVPGALQTVSEEYQKMFATLSSQPIFGGMSGTNNIFDIGAINNGVFRIGNESTQVRNSNIEGSSHINLDDRNLIFRGRKQTLLLTKNLSQHAITVNSQEELTEIRKLNLNSPIVSCIEQSYDDEMSKIVERVNISSDPLEITKTYDTECQQGLASDEQRNSVNNNHYSLKNIDESFANSKKRVARDEHYSENDNDDNLDVTSPNPKIKKRTTPVGKKRLPLKKRAIIPITSKSSPRGFHYGNMIVPNDYGAFRPVDSKIVEKFQFADTVGSVAKGQSCSAATPNSNSGEPRREIKDTSSVACKLVKREETFSKPEFMKTKKHNVDLAWKLSLRHISELFFNDPDVSTKFREGSLSCCSASRGTSSKSTHPKEQQIEENRAESILNSSIAHEFDGMDLNPTEQDVHAVKDQTKAEFSVVDDVTSNVSALATNDFTGSPSPQSVNHSESEIALQSPFVKDFLEHTKNVLENDNACISQIYDMETPCRADLGCSKSGNDKVSPLLKNYEFKLPMQTAASPNVDSRTSKSAVNRPKNPQEESVKSFRFSDASSSFAATSHWWGNENRTPIRQTLADISSGSDDSLRVLPSTSQRKAKKRVPIVPAEDIFHPDFSISSRNSDPSSWYKEGLKHIADFDNSVQKKANVGNMAGAKSNEGTGKSGKTDFLIPVNEPEPKNNARGQRMSLVCSNVIVKPVGSDRQSNEHDFLIWEDLANTLSRLQGE